MDINFYVSNTATEILNNSNLIDSLNKIAESNNSIPITSIINIIASGILASVAVYQAFQASKSKKLNLDLLEANKKMANENKKLVQKYDEMIQQNQENYYRDRLIKSRIIRLNIKNGIHFTVKTEIFYKIDVYKFIKNDIFEINCNISYFNEWNAQKVYLNLKNKKIYL